MVRFIFTKEAQKKFDELPYSVSKRIAQKLKVLKQHDDILSSLRRLSHFEPATHRLRIGPYRLILELRSQSKKELEFFVLDVGHRKDIYR